MTSNIIHSGLLPDLRKASTTSSLLAALIFLWPEAFFSSSLNSLACSSKSTSFNSSFIASAPIPALNLSPYCSRYSLYSASVNNCFLVKLVSPGSKTIYDTKYKTFSSALGDISKSNPMRLGMPLTYQI